eukprot:TRINITY_DN6719_c0_g1_i1.p1 TRINITY_DN6719_c0_g1~~TRINITY_DN6719_c0_g1_i1.p1  ORF type:complete len:280 (-),score=63.68 TRINITY_DN6719_c0_g1_i1:196-930(-)
MCIRDRYQRRVHGDDLESLGYVLMYFLRGALPWQNLKANNKKDKYERIMEKKLSTPIDVLCKGFPQEFAQYLTYCRNLRFEDKPDYNYVRNLLRDLFTKSGYEFDYAYDWTLLSKDKNDVDAKSMTTLATQGNSLPVESTPINVPSGGAKPISKEEEKINVETQNLKVAADRSKRPVATPGTLATDVAMATYAQTTGGGLKPGTGVPGTKPANSGLVAPKIITNPARRQTKRIHTDKGTFFVPW